MSWTCMFMENGFRQKIIHWPDCACIFERHIVPAYFNMFAGRQILMNLFTNINKKDPCD